jgi:putative transposase
MKGKPKMTFSPELLDQLLEGRATPDEIFGAEGLFGQLKKALAERILAAELDHHLAQDPTPNHRNGTSAKTVLTDTGKVPLAIPRDRAGTFTPQFVPKHRRRLPGFDAKVLSLYAHGMTLREMREHLTEVYGADVSPELISTVTDAVATEVLDGQQRPRHACYPVLFFDALRVKMRDEGTVRSKAVYVALGVAADGTKDVLGFWIEQTEGAKFWLRVMTELQSRGVQDILLAVVDGLKGFPEAITSVFPQTTVQTCIVHLLRDSLHYTTWTHRKAVASALKGIYQAPTVAAAEAALDAFATSEWGRKYPPIATAWRRHWAEVIPLFAHPPAIRKMLYTTNAIESLHMQLRKILKTRGHFPNDDAAAKLIYLALRNIIKRWSKAPRDWKQAMNQFAILYPDRFTLAE